MAQSLDQEWQAAFWRMVKRPEYAEPLRDAALKAQLGAWTTALTATAVAACVRLGLQASAKGHVLDLLPVPASEYLLLDLMAFGDSTKRWRFPLAVMEFENSRRDDRIAYSLWKVLCVRAALRVVFCYRKHATEAPKLMHFLREEVIQATSPEECVRLGGQTLVVVGSRSDAETFPYGFFKWWRLDQNTAQFHVV
jgi:hypothetical protein